MNRIKDQFLLNPDVTFLNFGSFGACPKPVLAAYQDFQNEFEEDPVYFYVDKGMYYLNESKNTLANYVNCDSQDIIFVNNPTYAVNVIAKSFPLSPNDEILTTDLEYGACDKTWEYYCEKVGAVYRRVPIRFPLESKEDFIQQFVSKISEKTKLIFISHITSATALILPVEEICREAEKRNIPIFIDGAHTPGHIELNLKELQPTYYTGACHKWLMAPKGCSFLYVASSAQDKIDPLIISWGYQSLISSPSKFIDYHQMNGTRDFTPFLCIPACLQFIQDNKWEQHQEYSKKLVLENALELNRLLMTNPIVPISTEFLGQMYSAEVKTTEPEELYRKLYYGNKIQIPVTRQGNRCFLRYSIQGFNDQKDLDYLFHVILSIT